MTLKERFFKVIPQHRANGKVYFQMAAIAMLINSHVDYVKDMKPHMADLIVYKGKSYVDFTDVRILLRDSGTETGKKYFDALFGDCEAAIQTRLN